MTQFNREHTANEMLNTELSAFEMAYHKGDVNDKLKTMTDIIMEHIIKCVLYPDNLSFNHWVRTELTSFAEYLCGFTKNLKKSATYSSDEIHKHLFGKSGTTITDMNTELLGFRIQNRHGKFGQPPYPDFKPTLELATKLFEAFLKVKQLYCDTLSGSAPFDEEEFCSKLLNIFTK